VISLEMNNEHKNSFCLYSDCTDYWSTLPLFQLQLMNL
jgi:hypothetical protein